MIAVDWGTSSFRAVRLGPDGATLDRRQAPAGILQVEGGDFAGTLRGLVGDWLAAGERRILMSGMIGSRQGWREASYLGCPAGLRDLAGALQPVEVEGAEAFIVPGLLGQDRQGVPDVMRGEETQIMGVLPAIGEGGIACLPGTHSKWALIADGRIAGFTTHMTGEAFAALRDHTILGRLMRRDAPPDETGFDAGVARSAEPGGLLHHLFAARTLVLTGRMGEGAAASYLSGLLIGHEVRAALPDAAAGTAVHLVGEAFLCRLYERALTACGAAAIIERGDAATLGLKLIGDLAPWT